MTKISELLASIGAAPYYLDDKSGIAILHADCREILPRIPAGAVDLLLTDPPYQIDGVGSGMLRTRDYLTKIDGVMDEGFDISLLAQFPNWMCFCSKNSLIELLTAANDDESRWCLLTWNKPNPTPLINGNYLPDTEYIVHHFQSAANLYGNYEDRSRYIVVPGEKTSDQGHPAIKPLRVMSRLLKVGSAEGQTILDPFLGSGSTLVAARNLGRCGLGIEIEERWCELGAQRLSQGVFDFEVAAWEVENGLLSFE
jgi:site-specific DNA-methyltransferase (adenine-specific)